MGYLIANDYLAQIQLAQRNQLTTDATVLVQAENRAITEVKSFLTQKYDIDKEFTNTNKWSNSVAYNAADRIYLDATAYSALSTYAIGALVLQAGNVYRCSTAILVPEAFNAAKWTLINAQYTIYYGLYPEPLFDLYGTYAIGDEVYYKGKIYSCLIATTFITHDVAIQYSSITSIPVGNVFPDDTENGSKYWEEQSTYTIPAGTLPTDTTYWTLGDNRNQQILGYTIDFVLYYLHARIAPQNIPQLRLDNYDIARTSLKDFAKGDSMTLDMIKKQPKQGGRIRYGGDVKNQLGY
jgi:hypothetical protein